ncbi:hypothetical protein CDAR_586501 [Caerostris darwini]|uniref:Uncharacterized protein n=1 Tax=Caerostris darwini TaxID=1538125 RepID=A0AAV4Q5I6_9ARAC|nr:hypothetical protein CDAR_586501 [Caerostris darwini]
MAKPLGTSKNCTHDETGTDLCVEEEEKEKEKHQEIRADPTKNMRLANFPKRKKEPVRRPPTVIAYAKVHCTLTWMELHLEMQALNSQQARR